MSTGPCRRSIRMEDHIGYLLKRLQHLMRSRIEDRMRAEHLHLTFPHAVVLASLAEEPGLSGARLARRSMVTPQTVNTILTRLEQMGLIQRRPDPEHGRVLMAYVTPAGEQMLERGAAVADDLLEQMVGKLDAAEQALFRGYLHRCIESLSEMDETPR